MMIETTFMRYGKGPGGLIGVTLKQECVKRQADKGKTISSVHKQESPSRIKSDRTDRIKLRNFLQTCIHPLDHNSHAPNKLINIYTGEISSCSNVNKSLEIGQKQMSKFQESLPGGFHKPLKKLVVKMKCRKKGKEDKEQMELYNTNVIFSRVKMLLSSGMISLKHIFSFKLLPILTSLFDNSGNGRYPKAKSTSKNKLKVLLPARSKLVVNTLVAHERNSHRSIEKCRYLLGIWKVLWRQH